MMAEESKKKRNRITVQKVLMLVVLWLGIMYIWFPIASRLVEKIIPSSDTPDWIGLVAGYSFILVPAILLTAFIAKMVQVLAGRIKQKKTEAEVEQAGQDQHM